MSKQNLLLFLFSIAILHCAGQDLQTVQRNIANNNYPEARQGIDSILKGKKPSSEAAPWYYKGVVYTGLVMRQEAHEPQLLDEALAAFRKYQEMDPKNLLMEPDNNVSLFQLYNLGFNKGVGFYNSEQYEQAYAFFSNALQTRDYIRLKKFSFNGTVLPPIDTQLLSLTAFSAYLSHHEEASIPLFVKLADLKMSGEAFKPVYGLLYNYFTKKKDAAKAARYLGAGKAIYPDEAYWIKLEMGTPADTKEKFARYDQLLSKYPQHAGLHREYAIDLYNAIFDEDKSNDGLAGTEKFKSLLARMKVLEPGSPLPHYMHAQYLQQEIYQLEDSIKVLGETTVALSRKKMLQAKLDAKWEDQNAAALDAYNRYLQEGVNAENKEQVKKMAGMIIAYYRKKNLGSKVQEYQEQLNRL